MAFELCTGGGDPSLGQVISPRISFSHDIPQTGFVPVEQYVRSSSTSSMDFDFCVFRQSFDLQDNSSSSADELFHNGKILPIEIKRRIGPAPTTQPPPPPPPAIIPPAPVTKPAGPKQQAGSSSKAAVFWKIKRSSSLNCGSGYARTFCPLPLLSRSNSTGSSSPIPKRTLYSSSSSRSSRDAFNPIPQNNNKSSSTKQKPPLMKSQQASSSRNNGVRITSVLNVSASSLFGMGSMFSHGNGRDKNKKNK
ncbi:hypothetical protein DM860_014408 [Cuscuta australis]|uniref:Uncharacterized protein n=1 Tax=Cuscuta australis TaxID=267555 RepID=A0A328DVG0_9ASTE|nr:hypothetical protein DM860_014408 [Cuscuta australis]